jgi:hypothetical protein
MAKRKIESNDCPPDELSEDRIRNLSLEQQIAVTQNIVNRSKIAAIAAAYPPEFPSKLAAFVHRNFLVSLAIGIAWMGYEMMDGLDRTKPFLGFQRGNGSRRGISFLIVQFVLLFSYFAPPGWRSRYTGKLLEPSSIRLAGRLMAGWFGLMGIYFSIRYRNFSAGEGILAFYIWGSYLAYGIFGRRRTLDLDPS